VAPIFVGRKDESDRLVQGLSDSLGGRGRLFLITGNAGVGKTRLADEIAELALGRGALVLRGGSFEDVSAPSYWPWTQVLRTILQSKDHLTALPASARAATSVLGLIPELRAELKSHLAPDAIPEGDDPGIGEAEPDLRAFRLFDAIATILRGMAARTPLLLVFDDLHSVDRDSLLLLKFVAREIRNHRIFVIGIYRKPETDKSTRSHELLDGIAREGTLLPLFGLQESETAEFVEAITGEPPDANFLKVLFQRTQGNAFFLEETLRSIRRGAATQTGVPDGVRIAVERSLESLRKAARDLLRIASVIGGEFDVSLLKASSNLSLDEVIAIVSEAESLGILSRKPESVHAYHFKHGLVAETLYQTLPKLEAIRLHLQIAQATEGLYQGDLDSHFAQLAHHYNESLPIGPADRVVHFCEQAGLRARRSCAYEDATQFFQTALNAAELIHPADPRLKLNLLRQLGEVSFAAGLFGRSRDWFQKATQIAQGLGDYEEAARLILGFVLTPSEAGTVDHSRVRMLRQALDMLGENDNPLRARLMARLAWELYWLEPAESVTPLSETALEVARRIQDNETLMEVLFYRHHATWSPDNLEERIAIARELIDRSGSKYNIWAMRAHYLLVVDLLELGSLSSAREEIERYSSNAREAGFSIGYGELARASCCLFEGKLDQGERWAERALQIGLRQELRGRRHREAHTFYMLSLRREQDRSSEMETMAQRLSVTGRVPVVRALLAVYYVEVSELTKSKAEYDRLVAGGLDKIRRDSIWLATMVLGALASVYLNDHDRSQQFYEMLLPYADRNAMLDIYVSYGPVAYYLGLLAAKLGRMEDSRGHFEKALEATERSGALLFLAQSLAAYASMLLGLKNETDIAHARQLIDRGLTLSSALDLTAVSSRLRSLQVAESPTEGSERPDDAQNQAIFSREGDYWTIAYEGKTARLKDVKGLQYIGYLLAHPGKEIRALDLAARASGSGEDVADAASAEDASRTGVVAGDLGHAGEMLDAQAKAAYQRRLSQLEEELEEARELRNDERIAKAEDEMEALGRELRRAIGLGGRDRRAASSAERARSAVTRAIRSALERVSEQNRELGRLLTTTIRTGTVCLYLPDERFPVSWRL
jgi:tetratricopeptide (TPR) repeat protein